MGLAGYVRNLPTGQVEVVAEGEKDKLEALLAELKKGLPGAKVTSVDSGWSGFSGRFSGFSIDYR